MLSLSIGVAIAINMIPSLAGAQALRGTLPDGVAGRQIDPGTTVRVLVPCPVGSPADIFARHLARLLSESSGEQFYVENVESGVVDPGSAQEAQSNGRTIFFGSADPTQPSACGD
jgi:tripartite-type tricarboxylate transporter receptor subunit TctC